jgi:hypothetical protein
MQASTVSFLQEFAAVLEKPSLMQQERARATSGALQNQPGRKQQQAWSVNKKIIQKYKCGQGLHTSYLV